MKKCSKCNFENLDSAKFCANCGNKFDDNKSQENENIKILKQANEFQKQELLFVTDRSLVGTYGLFIIVILAILFWCIVPLIILIYIYAKNKTYHYYIYTNKVVYEGGLFSKTNRTQTLTKVLSVTKNQSLKGSIFNYADIHVNLIGKENLYLNDVKYPDDICVAFEKLIVNPNDIRQSVIE